MLTPWKKSYDQPRQHIKKQGHYFANKGPSSQGYGFSSDHVWKWELDYKESWVTKNWCFWTAVLEKTLGSPLDCKEIKIANPEAVSESHSVVFDTLWPLGLYSPWNSPGQKIELGSLSLLQGIFPTQGSNPSLLPRRWILYAEPPGKPSLMYLVLIERKPQEQNKSTYARPLNQGLIPNLVEAFTTPRNSVLAHQSRIFWLAPMR